MHFSIPDFKNLFESYVVSTDVKVFKFTEPAASIKFRSLKSF